MSILVVLEQRGGEWNRMSFETLAAAQQFAGELNVPVSAAVLGQGIGALAAELAGKQLEKVYSVEHELLKDYTPDGYTAALRQLIARRSPRSCSFRIPTRCAIFCRSWPPRSAAWRSATWSAIAWRTAR